MTVLTGGEFSFSTSTFRACNLRDMLSSNCKLLIKIYMVS